MWRGQDLTLVSKDISPETMQIPSVMTARTNYQGHNLYKEEDKILKTMS